MTQDISEMGRATHCARVWYENIISACILHQSTNNEDLSLLIFAANV